MEVLLSDPRLEQVLTSPQFASVREALSNLLGNPVWFVARPRPGSDGSARERYSHDVRGLVDPTQVPVCEGETGVVAERARRLRAPVVMQPKPGSLIAGLPIYYKQDYLGVIGACDIPEEREATLRCVLVVLREHLTLFLDLLTEYDDLQLVHQIWRQLESTLECDELLPDVLSESLEALALERGAVVVVDDDGWFIPRASVGLDESLLNLPLSGVSRFDYDERVEGWRSPVVALPYDDPLSRWVREQLPPDAGGEGYSSVMIVPLIHDRELIGAILGASSGPVILSEDRMRMLRILSEGASANVANALLYESVRQKRDALSTVHTVHRLMASAQNFPDLVMQIGELAAHLIKVPKCVIMLLNPRRTELLPYAAVGVGEREIGYRPLAPGEGLIGTVAATATALRVSREEAAERYEGITPELYPDAHYLVVPMIDKELEGVIQLARSDRPFSTGERETVTTLAEQAVIAINNARLVASQQQRTLNVLRAVARASDAQDPHRQGHSEKVSVLADKIAAELAAASRKRPAPALDPNERTRLRLAALLHDVGYLGVRASAEKRELPTVALSLLASMDLEPEIGEMIVHVNERWDGGGYPHGLAGEAIPLGSRIIAVANQMMILLEGRTGVPELSNEDAVRHLQAESGTRFDPSVVEALARVVHR